MDILLYIWAGATVYLIAFYTFFHLRLIFYRQGTRQEFGAPVSVVICARNEAGNLRKNLPKIFSQKNVHFEVVVVNDRSTDATPEVLSRFLMQYPNLTVVENRGDSTYVGKKQALLLGLQKAKHDYFILTDADCEPVSDQWLSTMSSHFNEKQMVLGVSPYRYQPSFAGRLTQWETLLTAQHYLSFALAGIPYMGVGRNIGYSRNLFEKSDRFASHLHLPSGDDDLFVSQVANGHNTAIEINPGSFTWSEGPQNFNGWWRQKKRHLSTSGSYKMIPAVLLSSFGLAQLIFYVILIFLLLTGWQWQIVLGLLVLKFSIQLLTIIPLARKLKQTQVLWLFPVWEILTVVFLAIIHFQNKIAGRPTTWN